MLKGLLEDKLGDESTPGVKRLIENMKKETMQLESINKRLTYDRDQYIQRCQYYEKLEGGGSQSQSEKIARLEKTIKE